MRWRPIITGAVLGLAAFVAFGLYSPFRQIHHASGRFLPDGPLLPMKTPVEGFCNPVFAELYRTGDAVIDCATGERVTAPAAPDGSEARYEGFASLHGSDQRHSKGETLLYLAAVSDAGRRRIWVQTSGPDRVSPRVGAPVRVIITDWSMAQSLDCNAVDGRVVEIGPTHATGSMGHVQMFVVEPKSRVCVGRKGKRVCAHSVGELAGARVTWRERFRVLPKRS